MIRRLVPDPNPEAGDGVVTEPRVLALTWNWALDHSISSSTEGLVSGGIELLFQRLQEVWDAYVEEFGPEGVDDPEWPAYRFQRAIEAARQTTPKGH